MSENPDNEFTRLKALQLDDRAVAAARQRMPVGKFGGLVVSRLISGSNLISMNMHARDLAYMRDLAAHYNSQDRVFATLRRCEAVGINTIVLKSHNFARFNLSRYWGEPSLHGDVREGVGRPRLLPR